jgi:hypothetical protein
MAAPHLARQGSATQLIVDGQPFLALGGELTNNAATSLPMMDPIWPKLVAANLNTVLVGVAWGQFEPEEGHFNYTQVDGVIAKARENHLHIVFLWFGAWKNGTSSYPPLWVKKDYNRFPRIQIDDGRTVSISGPVETLSPVSDATRDADAAAFAALMRHIKQVDDTTHTVIMIQVENEVGVLRDSRDRSPAANRAFNGPVPAPLMSYLAAHKDSLIPEFRQVWADNGYKSSGTWEQVFGPGKPSAVAIPIQTTSPPMTAWEHDVSWRQLHWPSDEIFMAWNYARYVEAVAKAGKAEYDIPMYVNAWLQQPNHAWPGTYPSGGPLAQVHDIWRAGAPAIDILSPDLYVPYFDELCERYTRGGNPLFIPETGTSAANVIMAVGKYNTIGFSPFGIDGGRPIPSDLADAYQMLEQLSPVILPHQGTASITAVRMVQGDAPKQIQLGGYTMTFTYTGRIRGLAPQAKGGVESAFRTPPAQPGEEPPPPLEAAAVIVQTGPDEFYFGGGGMRVDFTPNTPGPQNVGLGVVEQGKFLDETWQLIRWIAGDDDAQGEILVLHPGNIVRVQLYRFP